MKDRLYKKPFDDKAAVQSIDSFFNHCSKRYVSAASLRIARDKNSMATIAGRLNSPSGCKIILS